MLDDINECKEKSNGRWLVKTHKYLSRYEKLPITSIEKSKCC